LENEYEDVDQMMRLQLLIQETVLILLLEVPFFTVNNEYGFDISRQVRNETLENEKACSVVRQVLA
jgi:hypothetical protein